jgi:hypothetical protein
MNITPQTHPECFREVTVGKYTYDCFNDAYNGALEMLEDAYVDAYLEANPAEKDKPFDSVKYENWKKSRAGSKKLDRAAAKVLFFPKNGAPALEGDVYDRLTQSTFVEALTFFGEERLKAKLAQSE